MIITDDFGIEIDVDEIIVDDNGHHVIVCDNNHNSDEISANDIDEYIFILENGECEVFSREEREHLMSL